MGNIRLQRITRIRDKRHTRIRMPATKQDVKNQQRKAKIIVIFLCVQSRQMTTRFCSSGGVKCDTPTSHKYGVPLALI